MPATTELCCLRMMSAAGIGDVLPLGVQEAWEEDRSGTFKLDLCCQ